MKTKLILLGCLFWCGTLPMHAVNRDQPGPQIVHASLFKNGFALIEQEIVIDESGAGLWPRPPAFVHGTFWVDSEHAVEVRTIETNAPVEDPQYALDDWQDLLAGRQVRVQLRNADLDAYAVGVVVDFRDDTTFVRNPQILVLQNGSNHQFIRTPDIVTVTALDSAEIPQPVAPMEKVTALELRFPDLAPDELPKRVTVHYLANGLSWAPSYRIALDNAGQLRLTQTAIVRNELVDLQEVSVDLISGFPNIAFKDVTAPLAPGVTLNGFFQQLAPAWNGWFFPQRQRGSNNSVVQQQVILSNTLSMPVAGVPVQDFENPGATGQDLHYQSLGTISLAKNDSLHRELATGEAQAERLVEWMVPVFVDPRDRNRYNEPDEEETEPWEILRFANPLEHPITTSPVVIYRDGQFQGQSLITFTNPGSSARVKVNKALSIVTAHEEQEFPEKRTAVTIYGDQYEQLTLEKTFRITNTRDEPTTVFVRHTLDGTLREVHGDSEPETEALPAERDFRNPRVLLTWTVELAPGETAERGFTFTHIGQRLH